MGRYRPPSPVGSKYITPEGKQRLAGELDFLWHKRRPAVTKALSAAAAEGDRSENAEYIYRKKELRDNARIKETGQVVHIKKVSDHGFALVRFRTGGEYLLLSDRLESVIAEEVRH